LIDRLDESSEGVKMTGILNIFLFIGGKMGDQEETKEEKKGTTEKLWGATRKTFHSASFKAAQYKRVVQKKIDLGSIHKKISNAHADLGKLVDDFRETGEPDILAKDEVQALFQKLDSLKHTAATLEAEIEAIRAEHPPEEDIG
jgi:hypothetical protein